MNPKTEERLKGMGYVQTIAGLYRMAKEGKQVKAKPEAKAPEVSKVHNESAEPIVKAEAKESGKRKSRRYRSRKSKR